MKPCKVCGTPTAVVFNINSKAKSICEDCSTSIFLQQASWYGKQKLHLPITTECNNSSKNPYEL